ncbi:MAG: TlpA family protein disulfide reductase [Alphaproteobacteria bacterium]
MRGARAALLLPALLVALLLAGCDDGPRAREGAGLVPGSPAGLVMDRLDGGSESLDHYRGRVVVLNVWATWCGPCRLEMPGLQWLAGALDPARHVVLGLSIDETPALVGEYLRERGITFARHIDRGGRRFRERMALPALPLTLILGRDGAVVWSVQGRREWGDPDVATWVRGFQ